MRRRRLGPGKLSPEDYYKMRIYRRDLPIERKREFASQRAIGLSPRWYYVTHDKRLANLLLEQEGVRVPQTYAICHPLRSWGKHLMLRSAEQITDYLTISARYPLVSKPVSGMLSQDVILIEGREADSGNLR